MKRPFGNSHSFSAHLQAALLGTAMCDVCYPSATLIALPSQVLGSGFKDLSGGDGPRCSFETIRPSNRGVASPASPSPLLIAATRVNGLEGAVVCVSPPLLGGTTCAERGSPVEAVQVRVSLNGRIDGLSPANASGGVFSYFGEPTGVAAA